LSLYSDYDNEGRHVGSVGDAARDANEAGVAVVAVFVWWELRFSLRGRRSGIYTRAPHAS